jgi:hypothetical protein
VLKVFLLVLIIAFIINSCRKDNKTTPQTISTAAVQQAKTWYENAYPVTSDVVASKITTQSVNTAAKATFDLSQIIKPDWQHPATYARLGSNVIEMPVEPGANFGLDIKNISASKKYNKTTFLLLNNGKGYQAYIMMIMADSAYVKNDFSKLAHNSYRQHDADGDVFYPKRALCGRVQVPKRAAGYAGLRQRDDRWQPDSAKCYYSSVKAGYRCGGTASLHRLVCRLLY